VPVQINEIEIQALSQQASIDSNQNWSIANLTRHVRALWHHVEKLETTGRSGNPNELVLRAGDASITLKKDGTILIKGRSVTIESWGDTNIKAQGNLAMKGAKIAQN
jgi:hypothetical protein